MEQLPGQQVRRRSQRVGRCHQTWKREDFLSFINDLLEKVFTLREHYMRERKNVLIIIDNASEHAPKDEFIGLIERLPNFAPLNNHLGRKGYKVDIIRAPPVSPQLNLCEYYNRTLKTLVCKYRHTEKLGREMLRDFRHGTKARERVGVLVNIVTKGLNTISERPVQHKCFEKMKTIYHQVILDKGKLHFSI